MYFNSIFCAAVIFGYQKAEELQLTLGVERVKGMITQIERDERFLMVFIF